MKNVSLFRNGAEEAGDDWLITDFAREQLEEYLRYRDEVGSSSGTGRKWEVPQLQGGSGEYLRYRKEWGGPQVQGGSGEYLIRYREEVGSTSDTGRKWEYLRYREEVVST